MAILFFCSAIGAVVVSATAVHRISVRLRVAREESHRRARALLYREQMLSRDAEYAKDRLRWVDLGFYTVEVYPAPSSPDSNIKNRVDIGFGARCNDRETREFLDARQAQVRSEISSLLVGLQREELLTPLGKYRLKKKIHDRLNRWIYGEYPKGRLEEVFISDLTIR